MFNSLWRMARFAFLSGLRADFGAMQCIVEEAAVRNDWMIAQSIDTVVETSVLRFPGHFDENNGNANYAILEGYSLLRVPFILESIKEKWIRMSYLNSVEM